MEAYTSRLRVHKPYWKSRPSTNGLRHSASLQGHHHEFEAKHGHYLARRNKAAEKNEKMKA
ncbi:hypothetical protein H5410_002974 [Solanum commersonii]|uniref:Uncharacterized protein n=1 Tax=Solanum commersonii TaxID=4109 RepID=A0A9J6B3H5_SOLCO|nr:hypothetical protein H5410_002974 [Solanum commersonii]